MNKETGIKELAGKYFRGEATADQEAALLEFIRESKQNMRLFRSMEKDWASAGSSDPGTEHEWSRLRSRISLRSEMKSRGLVRRRLRLRIASVAAVLFLIAGTYGTYRIVSDLGPAKYFVVDVPLGEKSRIMLSDSTVVWLNAGSTLKYSSGFDRSERRVELEGEGYFEVTKSKKGSRFTVVTSGYEVVVRGTRFDISAYPEDGFISTTLIEGKVDIVRGKQTASIDAGEKITLDTGTGEFSRERVDASLSSSWTENRFEFDKINFSELIAKLSRKYNVEIRLESDNLPQRRFHISLRNDETIGEVLKALNDIIPITVDRTEDNVYVIREKR